MPETLSIGDLTRLGESWQAARLDPNAVAPSIGRAVDRMKDLRAEHAQLLDVRSTHNEIQRRVAAGDSTIADALRERAALADRADLQLVMSDLARRVPALAVQELARIGDVLVTDHLVPAHQALVEEAAKLAPIVLGFVDDAAAVNAGAKTASAWVRLTEIADQLRLVERIAGTLRRYGITLPWPSAPDTNVLRFRHPELLPSWDELRGRSDTIHPALRLATVMESGAQPFMPTVAEAHECTTRRAGALAGSEA